MNRIGLISAEITLFFLGAIAPAYARQDQHDQNSQAPKQEEAKPAEQRQVKPEEQKQAKPEAQQQRQQQAKPTKPEQAKANGKPPQQQTQAPRQLHQQPKSQIEQTNANDHQQQQVRNQQAILSRPQSSRVPQRTADAQARQHAERALHLSATSRNRIPDERFHSNFGSTHEFRIGSPRMVDGYSRFQYGGYWFGFVQPWPGDWYYTDNVYVDFIGGQYYLCNPYYPGVHIAISVVM